MQHSAGDARRPYDVTVWILAIVVVVAVVLMVLASRRGDRAGPDGESATEVTDVTRDGLRIAGEPEGVVPWHEVWEITVITRRELNRTWYGFELRAEGRGLLAIDGPNGPGEAFLAESYRFVGFDHEGLGEALLRRGARVVCFSR